MLLLKHTIIWTCLLCSSAALSRETIPVATWPDGPPVMAPWTGHYRGGADVHSGLVDLSLSASGEFLLRYQEPIGDGDAITSGLVLGKSMVEGEWIAFRENGYGGQQFSWYPFWQGQRRCLIKRDELLQLVNDINARGEGTVRALACTDGKDGKAASAYRFNAAFSMPVPYRNMLLRAPLVAGVTGVLADTTSSGENQVKGWHAARLKINRGTLAGVFSGMRLYSNSLEVVIGEVGAEHAFATITWLGNSSRPTTGMALSSRAPMPIENAQRLHREQ